MDGTATERTARSPGCRSCQEGHVGMTRMRSIVITAGLGLVITLCACGNGPPEVAGGGGGGQVVGTAKATGLGSVGKSVTANSSLQFAPGTITVATGQVIQWTVAQDSVPHNVTFDSAGTLTSPPTLGPGETWEVKFTVAGTYAYRCTIHAGMNGQVTVTPGSAKSSSGAAGAPPKAAGAASASP
jgi:plastocyanin